MKVYLSFCFILLLLSAPAFAELSVKDIEVINKIVTESEARMKGIRRAGDCEGQRQDRRAGPATN